MMTASSLGTPLTRLRALPKEIWSIVLWQPLKEKKNWLLVIGLSLAILAASQALLLFLLGPIIKVLFAEQPKSATVFISDLLPSQMRSWNESWSLLQISREDLYILLPLLLVVASLTKSVFTYLNQYHLQRISLWISMGLRNQIFKAILGQDWLSLGRQSPAQWMSIVMNDVQFLQMRFSDLAAAMIKDVVVVVVCLFAMFLIHPLTAFVLLILMGPLAWSLGQVGRRVAKYAHGWQIMISRFAEFALSVRNRFDFMRSQKGEVFEGRRFTQLNQSYYRLAKRSILVRSAFAPVLEWFGFLLFALILWAVGRGMWGQELHGDRLIQFLAGIGLILRPLRNIGEQYSRLGEVVGALQRASSLLIACARKEDITEHSGQQHFDSPTWPINVEQMLIAYGDEPIIDCRQLRIDQGQAIAVVGPSGGGKSTLVRTLAGLLTAQSWQASLSQESLHAQTSFVSQKPFLFKDTVRANLLYGKDHMEISERDLWEVLSRLDLDEVFSQLPEKLDTDMGATQTVLSGGQLQRLTLARSLLDDRALLVCDEVTSALDPEVESKLINYLHHLVNDSGKSLIFVTHRVQMLDRFDLVWFVESGKVCFVGSPAELKGWARYQEFLVGEHLE